MGYLSRVERLIMKWKPKRDAVESTSEVFAFMKKRWCRGLRKTKENSTRREARKNSNSTSPRCEEQERSAYGVLFWRW